MAVEAPSGYGAYLSPTTSVEMIVSNWLVELTVPTRPACNCWSSEPRIITKVDAVLVTRRVPVSLLYVTLLPGGQETPILRTNSSTL